MEEIAAGVIVRDGRIVVVYEDETKVWSLPKGHIKEGEIVLTAAQREIKEETGIDNPKFITNLGTYERSSRQGPDVKKRISVLLFTTTQEDLTPKDPENSEVRWVRLESAASMLTYAEDKEFLESITQKVESEIKRFKMNENAF